MNLIKSSGTGVKKPGPVYMPTKKSIGETVGLKKSFSRGCRFSCSDVFEAGGALRAEILRMQFFWISTPAF